MVEKTNKMEQVDGERGGDEGNEKEFKGGKWVKGSQKWSVNEDMIE